MAEEVWVVLAHNAAPVTVEGVVNIGGLYTVTLPDEDAQRKGFALGPNKAAATAFLDQFPDRYKRKLGGPASADDNIAAALARAKAALKPKEGGSDAETAGTTDNSV